MFYNLKIAIRNLRRNGLYSAINITGLTVGLATCIFIALWVYDELNFDRFHKNRENIYLVNSIIDVNSYQFSAPGLSVYAQAEMPEIKNYCRIRWASLNYFIYDDRQIILDNSISRGGAVDSSFFSMFSFPLMDGNPQKPFLGDYSIILSETTVRAVFGDENPMGKALKTSWDGGKENFYVTGIMKDMPQNSSIQYDYLLPLSLLKKTYRANGPFKEQDTDIGRINYLTYLELYPKTNVKHVEEKLKDIMIREMSPHASFFGFSELPPIKIPLQQISDQHLYNADGSAGAMTKVRLFAIIAGLILVIACINYVNLVTARTGKRTKEMSIRKVLGAKWFTIIRQSLQETCVMLGIAIVLASVLIWVSLPAYNYISGKEMVFDILSFRVLMIYGITVICVLGLAGLYPSFFLASVNSSGYTKNRHKHASFRRVLVVLQFVCSIVLIVSTLVITLQMNFIRKKDLGYDKENVICFGAWGMSGKLDVVRSELLKNPAITGIATATFDNMISNNFDYGVSWPGSDKSIKFCIGWVDFNFFDVMNIRLAEGQLPPEASADRYCLLNETAVREMQLKEPLNQNIYQNTKYITVSGIVKDFNFESLNQPVSPLILYCAKEELSFSGIGNSFYIKTTAQGTQSALASIEKLWKQYCPFMNFSYSFLDENFERLYRTDIQMGRLLYIFAFIAILISCLGLFGLVTFTAETKTKEIGIRKVLGASVASIVKMLSKEFLILVGIAMLIAFPLAYYWLDNMLQDYAYHINISWWIFALAGMITVALTLLTVGWKAIKAATENPVNALKSE